MGKKIYGKAVCGKNIMQNVGETNYGFIYTVAFGINTKGNSTKGSKEKASLYGVW